VVFTNNRQQREHDKFEDLGSEPAVRTLLVDGSGTQITSFGGGTQYDVDDAAGATDTGTVPLVVRDDSLTTLTPVDGDYTFLRVNSTGALHVTGGGGGTEYTEDVATPNPIIGTATMIERDDQLATITPVEGDWTGLRGSSKGALWVTIPDASGDPITSFGGGTQYQVDDVAGATDTGTLTLAVRDNILSTITPADGDYAQLRVNSEGALWVNDVWTELIQADTTTIAGAISGSEMQVDVVTSALPGGASTAALQLPDGHNVTVDNASIAVTATNLDIRDLTSASDSVEVLQDTHGDLNVDNWAAEDGGTSLSALNIDIDDSPTFANSADVTTTGYRTGTFSLTLDSTGTGTHKIKFILQEKNGSNYHDVLTGYWGECEFEDTAFATALNISLPISAREFPKSGTMRIRAEGTNTTASNYFTITNAYLFLQT
jgi:hypothetical protein